MYYIPTICVNASRMRKQSLIKIGACVTGRHTLFISKLGTWEVGYGKMFT